jgi:tetratricopeptide (TPR) repeat protein
MITFSKVLFKGLFKSSFKTNGLMRRFFTDCGKSQCGCKGSTQPESDEIEKKMKSMNYKIIQCINLGKYDDALELSDDYIKQLKDNYGDEHPFYCSAVNNKAFILKTCGEYDEAKVLFEEVIEKYKKIYGEESEKVVITMQNLATLYRDVKKFEKAIDLFEKLLEMAGKGTISIKPNILANIYNSVSGCYRNIKSFKESEKALKMSYDLIVNNFGEDNLPLGTVYNNLGLLYKDEGRFKEALDHYTKAFDIRQKFLPNDHPDVIAIKHNIGQLYYDNGDKDNAMKYFNENIDTLGKKENLEIKH